MKGEGEKFLLLVLTVIPHQFPLPGDRQGLGAGFPPQSPLILPHSVRLHACVCEKLPELLKPELRDLIRMRGAVESEQEGKAASCSLSVALAESGGERGKEA